MIHGTAYMPRIEGLSLTLRPYSGHLALIQPYPKQIDILGLD